MSNKTADTDMTRDLPSRPVCSDFLAAHPMRNNLVRNCNDCVESPLARIRQSTPIVDPGTSAVFQRWLPFNLIKSGRIVNAIAKIACNLIMLDGRTFENLEEEQPPLQPAINRSSFRQPALCRQSWNLKVLSTWLSTEGYGDTS